MYIRYALSSKSKASDLIRRHIVNDSAACGLGRDGFIITKDEGMIGRYFQCHIVGGALLSQLQNQ